MLGKAVLAALAAGSVWAQTGKPEPALTLLAKRCAGCHNAAARTSGLDLTSRDAAVRGGKSGPALIPGDPAGSPMARRISGGQMPPGAPLPAAERETVLDWIRRGAPWTGGPIERKRAGLDWWSLQPLSRAEPSASDGIPAEWTSSRIDRYLFDAMRRKGLRPSPPADRRTLIRRASFDLTGLPPAPEDVESFVADPDPAAYERLIDRLLASPQYGERWGRHWLDVARFGESHGFEQNHLRDNAWPYRDYVIRSFNQDKPFDRMILEQLAGDLVAPGDPEIEPATGFLVAGPHDKVKIQNIEGELQKRANELDDIVATTAAAFLGLTVNCARCHDHKFDPVPQADYYRLQAVFAGIEHEEREIAPAAERERVRSMAAPIRKELADVNRQLAEIRKLGEVSHERREAIERAHRPPLDPRGTEERWTPARLRFVKFTVSRSYKGGGAVLDEIEVWTPGPEGRNVALAAAGGRASARSSRVSGDGSAVYAPGNLIDGKYDQAWISGERGGQVTIEFAREETVDRLVWSRDRMGGLQERFLTSVPIEYVIEGSLDGERWTRLASSDGRLPYAKDDREEFFLLQALDQQTRERRSALAERKQQLERDLAKVPKLPMVYAGTFSQPPEPPRIHKRGNPTDLGDVVSPGGLTALGALLPPFELSPSSPEGDRRLALARWLTDSRNALTARVLANRIWHFHFGTGIVATPSDFGFNGERPSHPELLDYLGRRVHELGWRLKPLHREIMLSAAYRQSGAASKEGLAADAGDRLLWRFPPRRLEAEAVRDSILAVSGKLDRTLGGPGFRLYRYSVDNVATYSPAEEFPPSTWRRAVYQQSARSVRDDVLGTFDCPDSSLPEPKRAATVTALQALTLLNSRFVVEQAGWFAARLETEVPAGGAARIERAFRLAFGRPPDADETAASLALAGKHGWIALARALYNANEFIYVH